MVLRPYLLTMTICHHSLFMHASKVLDVKCRNLILPALYVRMLFPTDDSLIPFCFLTEAGLQGELFGILRTLIEHVFSRLGMAWRWEGRSMMKSPNSSVTPTANPDLLFFPPFWQLTATKAPTNFKTDH